MGRVYFGFLRWQCGFFLRFVRDSLVCRILVSEIGRLWGTYEARLYLVGRICNRSQEMNRK
jgi:hypothetical protein